MTQHSLYTSVLKKILIPKILVQLVWAMIQATIYILSSSQMNLTQSGLTTTNLVGIHTLKLGKEKKSKKCKYLQHKWV